MQGHLVKLFTVVYKMPQYTERLNEATVKMSINSLQQLKVYITRTEIHDKGTDTPAPPTGNEISLQDIHIALFVTSIH